MSHFSIYNLTGVTETNNKEIASTTKEKEYTNTENESEVEVVKVTQTDQEL